MGCNLVQAASTVLSSILKPVFSLSSVLMPPPPFLRFLRQGVNFEMYSADYEKVRLGANILQIRGKYFADLYKSEPCLFSAHGSSVYNIMV